MTDYEWVEERSNKIDPEKIVKHLRNGETLQYTAEQLNTSTDSKRFREALQRAKDFGWVKKDLSGSRYRYMVTRKGRSKVKKE